LLDFQRDRSFWPWLVAPSTSTSSTNQILFKMSNWQLREWLQNQPRFRNPLGWRIWNAAVSVVAWLFSVFSKHLSHAWGEWGEYMMFFTEAWDRVSCKWLIESYRIIIESSKNHPKISCFSCTIFWFQEIRRFGVRLSEKSPASPAPWPKAHWSVAASLELLACTFSVSPKVIITRNDGKWQHLNLIRPHHSFFSGSHLCLHLF
jgi:hypothetical protein